MPAFPKLLHQFNMRQIPYKPNSLVETKQGNYKFYMKEETRMTWKTENVYWCLGA